MGWLKKITRPISKVLDKIIPNEIKPALPYLSAFAPYMAPGLFGAGASGIGNLLRAGKYANVLGGGILGGGLNIGSQLAQEGSEGEFSGLSALLAAGQGAMAVPGAEETFASSRIVGRAADGSPITAGEYATLSEGANLGGKTIEIAGTADPGIITRTMPIEGPLPFDQVVKGGTTQLSGLDKARNIGLRGLEGGSKFIEGAQETLKSPGLNKETLAAIAPGAAQGTGDLAMADARRALNDYNAGLEEGSEAWYDDNARRVAIRSAMEAAGHIEDDILDAIASLGLKDGGRVGRAGGGMMSVLPKGTEMDYRGGGMIPMGSKERADDVPARLSKNEFVMTADAVKAAGGGSVNRGAKRMYDLMHNLEARV